jgi:hypothetical protein
MSGRGNEFPFGGKTENREYPFTFTTTVGTGYFFSLIRYQNLKSAFTFPADIFKYRHLFLILQIISIYEILSKNILKLGQKVLVTP